MTETCAPDTSGYEVALPRRAVLPPVASLSAAETAARGDVGATVAAPARVTATVAAPLGSNRTTCPTAGRSRAVVGASSTVADALQASVAARRSRGGGSAAEGI